ncbi:MAG: asparaginase [Rhodospirillales bacterium]|nr:asparaginase [Rhodospirillales bacterium]MDE2199284.1 asparaginase [Rhodospirillales bacterium]MDE2575349.1 asparaginase [Rhodospirillales bacterium]
MDPVLVEILRGGRVESAHHGAAVIADAKGSIVFGAGDIGRAVFPRSAVKALLALPLIETGAAERLGLTDSEIALACSSHSGEEAHTAVAASMLARAGRDQTCLECGSHWPINEAAARRLAAQGAEPSALHNNCSGKHAGFICLACDQRHDPAGYVQPDHPTMGLVTTALAEMTATTLDATNRAIDGCSIPTYAIPLRALAQGFARFGSGEGLTADRAAAARTIRAAVAANPLMVAGTDRFDTRLMGALGGRVFTKTGAEGVYCVAIPELGLGIAVKCEDGAGRAAEVATAALIARLLPDSAETLAPFIRPVLRNWVGTEIGAMGPAAAFA